MSKKNENMNTGTSTAIAANPCYMPLIPVVNMAGNVRGLCVRQGLEAQEIV